MLKITLNILSRGQILVNFTTRKSANKIFFILMYQKALAKLIISGNLI